MTDHPQRDQGSVFVNWIELDDDLWGATWQRGPEHRDFDGTREESIAWALAQAADHRWIFDAKENGYVPLHPA